MTDYPTCATHEKDPIQGSLFLREWIAYRWLRPVGIEARPDEILIADNAVQPLSWLAHWAGHTSSALADNHISPEYINPLVSRGLQIAKIFSAPRGPDISALAQALRGPSCTHNSGPALYLTHPGSLSAGFSAERRAEIAEEINRHVALLVELYSESPIHAHGVQNGVILGNFPQSSRSMSWIWARSPVLNHLIHLRESFGHYPDPVEQSEILGWLWF